jgi:hypothetical protein
MRRHLGRVHGTIQEGYNETSYDRARARRIRTDRSTR